MRIVTETADEWVETAIVFGIVGAGIHLTARSTDSRIHLGDVFNDAFGDVGSAGGHREMAGGEVPLGIFADYTPDDSHLFAIVDRVISSLIAELNFTAETQPKTHGDSPDK